jgi:tetratricopeptide (TPR) repeat protein
MFGAAVQTCQIPSEPAATLLVRLAWAQFRLGLYPDVRQTLHRALEIYTVLGDAAGEAHCLYQLGNVDEGVGDFDNARTHFEAALKVMRQHDNHAATARTLNSLGLLSLNSGDALAAVTYHLESLELRRQQNAPRAMFIAQLNLGDARKNLGQLEPAKRLFEACFALAKHMDDHFGETLVLSQLADVARREGELEHATGLYQNCLERCQNMGHGYVETIVRRGLGLTLLAQANPEAARAEFKTSLGLAWHLNIMPQALLSLCAWADLETEHGQPSLAYSLAVLGLKQQTTPPQYLHLEQLCQTLGVGLDEAQKAYSANVALEELLPVNQTQRVTANVTPT